MSQSIKQITEEEFEAKLKAICRDMLLNTAGERWLDLNVLGMSKRIKALYESKLQAIRAETLESLKYNIVGLFPVNRIHKMSQEEIIELLHSFIDKKIEAENPSKGEKE